jgi:DNA-binding NtrC family response regulator
MKLLERYRWPGNVRELQNVLEQLIWMGGEQVVDVGDLPPTLVAAVDGTVTPAHERRRLPADHLYEALIAGTCAFWTDVYPMFINRDITRADLVGLVRRALSQTNGNYRAVLSLLKMEPADYKRFLNLLSTHGCSVDFREFRSGRAQLDRPIEPSFKLPSLKDALLGNISRRSGTDPE